MEQIMEHNIDPPVQQILRTPFAKLCMNSVFYPMNFARILIQLGHDPFPLSRGKKRIFFGPPVYFQPNFFKYIKNIWQSHGWPTVYTGIGAHLAHSVAFDLCYKYTVNQLDEFYPELGGRMDEEDKQKMENPRELGTHQLIRVRVRQAIRDTVSHCISTAIVQPFWVIMVRQIAQHIGNDTKYAPIALLQPLRLIGDEEGPSGLFSGLIPQLIGVVFFVWGSAVLSIVVEEVIKYSEKDQDLDDQQIESYFTNLRSLSKMVVGYFIRGWRYPFEVVAAIMATAGSRLAVSMLPFSPLFTHWSDAYDYLTPFELYRGNQVILRQERGPVSVGTDGKLYASKKHFI